MNLSPLKAASDKYNLEPSPENRILVESELDKLRAELSYKNFSEEQLKNELYELQHFYNDTKKSERIESETKEDQLCRIKRTIRYVSHLLAQMKGVTNGNHSK